MEHQGQKHFYDITDAEHMIVLHDNSNLSETLSEPPMTDRKDA